MSSPIENVLDHLPADRPAGPAAASPQVTDSILSIPVTVQVVLGTVRLPLSRVASLHAGSVINLDQKLGSPATILVNGREVARGDLFVLDGEDARLGITVTEVIASARHPAAP